MNIHDCTRCQDAFDLMLVDRSPPAETAWAKAHLAACPLCTEQFTNLRALRDALRGMEVPTPRAGFADSALAAAVAQGRSTHRQQPKRADPVRRRGAWRRIELWAGAALGAVAAAALMIAVTGLPERGTVPLVEDAGGLRVALYEPHEITLAIDSDEAIAGATLTVQLAGGIDLVGFGERREISWQTDLDSGTNLLALPIIAHSLEDGRLTALVQHNGATQRIEVRVRVDNPSDAH